MKISITPYTSFDQKGVKEIVLNGLAEFGFTYNLQYDSDLDNPGIYIKDGGMFYVLKIGNQIIGTVAIKNNGNHLAELKRLYVEKNYQGKGYGSQLFDKAVVFCKEHGFTKLEFETNKLFTKAHLLYKKRDCRMTREDERSYFMEKIII